MDRPAAPSVHDAALGLVEFWRQAGRKAWFTVDLAFDDELRARFGSLHDDAVAGKLDWWVATAPGSLALVLLLDQLSRNLNRGSALAFANDQHALQIAEAVIDASLDQHIDIGPRPFIYLPFQHAENLKTQDRSVQLTATLAAETGNDEPLRWARHHRDIIARFGRFPHRNIILGRANTPEELAFMAEGGFAG